jgi:hypothetical protein
MVSISPGSLRNHGRDPAEDENHLQDSNWWDSEDGNARAVTPSWNLEREKQPEMDYVVNPYATAEILRKYKKL